MEKTEEKLQAMEPVLLIKVSDQMQGTMITGLLEDAKIPVLVKDKGIGGYMKIYMGYSVYGADIYVDKNDYTEAKKIIDFYLSEAEEEAGSVADGEPDDSGAAAYNKRRQQTAGLILGGIILLGVLGIVISQMFV